MNTFIWYFGLIFFILSIYLVVGIAVYNWLWRIGGEGDEDDYWEYFFYFPFWPFILYGYWKDKKV